MKGRYYIPVAFLLGLAIVLLFGCTTSSVYEVDNDDVALINNETWLYDRLVETSGEELNPDESSKALGGISITIKKSFFLMYKVAHIQSPTLDGNVLQATDVAIAGDGNKSYAYVTYAMAGDEFYGGLDVIELKKGFFPKIKSRLLTKKEDINSVTYDSVTNKIFLGLHVNPFEYDLDTDSHFYGAYLRSVELDKNNKIKVVKKNIVSQERALHSWAANDAAILGDQVLIPVGAIYGGVEILPSGDITSDENFISGINDTRAVDTYTVNGTSGFVVYQGPSQNIDANGDYIHGTPKLYVYDENKNLQLSVEIPGPETDESKSAVEVHGNVAFIAASDGGVYAIDITNGTQLFHIANPSAGSFGLTADKLTANDVTVGTPEGSSTSVIFIANGEYGVRAYRLPFNIEETEDVAAALSGYDPDSNYLGYIHLGTGNSANSLLFRNGYLFVGTGLGGLNVVYIMDVNFSVPWGINGRPYWAKPVF